MTTASQAQPAAQVRHRNRRGEGDRLREEIITAASQMIAETGDDSALTLRGVAKRIGIAAPSIYRHFPNVEHLKMAVVGRSFAEFTQARDAATPADGDDTAAVLLARCRAYCRFALANPGPYRFLFSQHAPVGPEGYGAGMPAFQALAESIRACQQAGTARAADDPQWLAAQVFAALHGLVLLRMNRPAFPWPAPVEQMADQAVARLICLEDPADRHPA